MLAVKFFLHCADGKLPSPDFSTAQSCGLGVLSIDQKTAVLPILG